MPFNLEKLIAQVFSPQSGDVVTVMVDRPHGEIPDNDAWRERRQMAEEWRRGIERFAGWYGTRVNPLVTFPATGSHAADLPAAGTCGGDPADLEQVIRDSTILLALTQFSASAPLLVFARRYDHLRVASLPHVSKSMEETGLSADWDQVAAACAALAPLFERAVGAEVTFSTGHRCHFDLSNHNVVVQDTGLLHPGSRPGQPLFGNLPAGEVFTVPNEAPDSRTAGQIPYAIGDETVVFVIEHNQIIGVKGDGPAARERRDAILPEPALRNIAELAIGCNDHAVVTGNVLEDEKAGFHWAYGRSDHIGGTVGPDAFSSPKKVSHIDMVYAKGNPIVCARLEFIHPDGTRQAVIIDGVRVA
jgi:hypothetical protein